MKLKTRSETDCTFLVYVPSIIVDKQFWFIDFQFNHIVGVEKIRPVGRIQPAKNFRKKSEGKQYKHKFELNHIIVLIKVQKKL